MKITRPELLDLPSPLSDAGRRLAVRRALALFDCSIPGGTFDRGFVRRTAVAAQKQSEKLSGKQADQLARLAWKYRRQLPAVLVPPSKPASSFPPSNPG